MILSTCFNRFPHVVINFLPLALFPLFPSTSHTQDDRLRELVAQHGGKKWQKIAEGMGGGLTLDQCQVHWHHSLRHQVEKEKEPDWSPEEVRTAQSACW